MPGVLSECPCHSITPFPRYVCFFDFQTALFCSIPFPPFRFPPILSLSLSSFRRSGFVPKSIVSTGFWDGNTLAYNFVCLFIQSGPDSLKIALFKLLCSNTGSFVDYRQVIICYTRLLFHVYLLLWRQPQVKCNHPLQIGLNVSKTRMVC